MKASELRIGNLCQDKLSGAQLKVTGTHETDISFYVVDRNLFPLQPGWQAEPIPLTEEWLLKFDIIKLNFTTDMPKSFQKPDIDKDGNIWYTWVKGAFNLEIQKNGEIWFEVYSHYIHVKYVHQLQNLYFALTGEELTIKE